MRPRAAVREPAQIAKLRPTRSPQQHRERRGQQRGVHGDLLYGSLGVPSTRVSGGVRLTVAGKQALKRGTLTTRMLRSSDFSPRYNSGSVTSWTTLPLASTMTRFTLASGTVPRSTWLDWPLGTKPRSKNWLARQ